MEIFTYKYKQHEFFISVEYYHGIMTIQTDYNGERIKEIYYFFSKAEAKKRFRQHLRDITDNPTKHNIFLEQ